MTDIETERMYSRMADKAMTQRATVEATNTPRARMAATSRIELMLSAGWASRNELATKAACSEFTVTNFFRDYKKRIESRWVTSGGRGSNRKIYRLKVQP